MVTSRLLLPVLALALGACSAPPDNVYPGYAEADYVRVASPLGGTLARLYVERGQQAAAGADAFVLEQDNERAARDSAAARLARARASVADLEKGRRPDELDALRAQLGQAEAAQRLSHSELARVTELARARFVSEIKLDEARAALARDQQRVRELQAQLRLARLPARADQLAAAREDVRAAQAELERSEWSLRQKSIKLPLAATVEDVLYREGELVPAGMPVLRLLAPRYLKARFYVPEARLAQLRLGQPVHIRCDGCGAPLSAKISFIAHDAEYTSPLIYSRENRASLVFMVEAAPAPADAARLHPGQPLEVRLAEPAR